MNLTSSAPTLREALYELAMTDRALDAALLDEFVRRFPQYSQELTDFAVEQALEALSERADSDGVAQHATVTPEVSRALSAFHNQLHVIAQSANHRSEQNRLPDDAGIAINPFEALSRDDFRGLARRMKVNTVFLGKLRDRQLDPSTIPERFLEMVAREARAPLSVVVAHFAAAPVEIRSGKQFYKADEKPQAIKRQSFDEAVRGSGLSQEEQADLLRLL
ncbi:MAG TPA: hypothetical protein VEA63_01885 [Opitutus sp.]|nr:hypothetical protein [Opitutus sp.]